jgi:hypothetical protein
MWQHECGLNTFAFRLTVENMFMVRLEVLTTASMKMAVSWVVAPCSVVEVYRRFKGTLSGTGE